MKYAIISDIHGNYIAMQKILNDAKAHMADVCIFAGDYCAGAPWPRDVVEMIQSMEKAVVVKGNEEAYLNISDGDDGQFEISRWCGKQLSAKQIEWLNQLPEQIEISDGAYNIYITHKSEKFIGSIEFDKFHPTLLAERYNNQTVPHEKMLAMINDTLDKNRAFVEVQRQIPKGIYIFGHSHVQWYKETDGHIYINPGSCGLPQDCEEFGAPYTLLTIEGDKVSIEERRVKYDVHDLIEKVKKTSQYKEAYVWSEITFKEWIHCRDYVDFFLKFAEEYANKIGDTRRPFVKETWQEAYAALKKANLKYKNCKTYSVEG